MCFSAALFKPLSETCIPKKGDARSRAGLESQAEKRSKKRIMHRRRYCLWEISNVTMCGGRLGANRLTEQHFPPVALTESCTSQTHTGDQFNIRACTETCPQMQNHNIWTCRSLLIITRKGRLWAHTHWNSSPHEYWACLSLSMRSAAWR